MSFKAKTLPRGVFYGWWIAIAFFFINVYWGGAIQTGFTVFFNPLRTALGLPAFLVTLAIQLRAVIAMVASPIVGTMFDRFGPRPLILGSGVVTTGGMVFLSFASNTATFFAALLVVALGSAVWMAGTGPATMANWFVRHRGKAIGFILAGISLGGVLVPAMVWMEQHWGWQGLARAVAGGLLLVNTGFGVLLRHRPEQHGLRPDGDPPDRNTAPADVAPAGPMPSVVSVLRPPARDLDFSFREALQTRAFWALVLAQAMTSIGGQSAMLFFIPHLQADAGIRPAVAGVALTVISLLGVISQPVVGWLADTFNKRLVYGISSAFAASSVLLFALVAQTWHLVLFVLLYGLTARTGFPVLASILADYFGRTNFGKIQGVVLSVTNLTGTVSALGVAAAFDATNSYVTPFLVVGGLEFLSIVFLMGAVKPRRQSARLPS